MKSHRIALMVLAAAGMGSPVSAQAIAGQETGAEDAQCRVLFDFEAADAIEAWKTTNDNVMGGRSSGGPAVADGTLIFSGVTNTDGGGFSSVKASVPRGSLEGVTSFRIRYRGDGRRYQFSTETGERRRLFFRLQYWSEFEALNTGSWEETDLPVSGFQSYFFGEPLDDRVLDPARIRDLGFFIYDKEDGPFELQVDWIKACP